MLLLAPQPDYRRLAVTGRFVWRQQRYRDREISRPIGSLATVSGDRSSTYLPAKGFWTIATTADFRKGGSARRPYLLRTSSTKVSILLIFIGLPVGRPTSSK